LILFQKLPESNTPIEIPAAAATTTTMSSVPHRPISVASTASNQNPSNSNKNQQVKQNKSAASGEKTNSDAGSINAMSEIS
jgi:hypothetical protein